MGLRVLHIWWTLIGAFAPYAKIVEYGVIFATIGLGFLVARSLRAAAREAASDVGARLRIVTQALALEMAGDLEAAGKAAIARVRMAATEEQAPEQQEPETQRQAHDRWWQPVVDMKFSDPGQEAPRLRWKNNVRVNLPWDGTWLTGWHNDSLDGVCGVGLSGRVESVEAFWRAIRKQASALEKELPAGSTVEPGRFGIGIQRPNAEFRDDDERRAWIIHNLDRFASVLRPWMAALAEKRN